VSSDSNSGQGMERKRLRAEHDVRRSHAMLIRMVGRFGKDGWDQRVSGGWSPAEISLHLLLTAEEALHGLRVAAAACTQAGGSASITRMLDKRMTLLTWKLSRSVLEMRSAEPRGLILEPDQVEDRGTTWAADAVQFFREQPLPLLGKLHHSHPALGAMSPFEWVRFIRIYFSHYDLWLDSESSG